MVNSDGTAYLEYEVRNTVNEVVTSDTLYLMQINPDNSSSSTILSATTQNETQYPGNIIPDGNGGVLATWSVSVVQGTQLTYPYQAVDVSGGFVGTPYNLPFSPQSVDITKQPVLVLGENGVAFAKGQTTVPINGVQTTVDQIASFNIGSGGSNIVDDKLWPTALSIGAAPGLGPLVGISQDDPRAGVLRGDVFVITEWAKAMVDAGALVQDVKAFVGNSDLTTLFQNSEFKKKSNALQNKMAAIVKASTIRFDEPWGMVSLFWAGGSPQSAYAKAVSQRLTLERGAQPALAPAGR